MNKLENLSINYSDNYKKFAIIVTIGFFFTMMYVSIFHHMYFYETDGMHYLQAGEQIIHGDKNNVKLFDAPIGGPVFYATLNEFVDNGFILLKMISLLSITGVVFFSYFIVKNIFNQKIALLTQLFFAFNLRIQLESIWAMNEALPLFLTIFSLYFITKKQSVTYLAITGAILGISFMIRYSSIFVLFGIIIFLLIYTKKNNMKLVNSITILGCFLILVSPLLIYNYSNFGHFLDSDPTFYMIYNQEFQTPEWRNVLKNSQNMNLLEIIFADEKLFLKNYFYNLFYQTPNLLFNFNSWTNLSIIPLPLVGMIPVIGGLIYWTSPNLNYRHLILSIGVVVVCVLLILIFGDFKTHFFMLIIVPILILSIVNMKNIEKNRMFLVIIFSVFLLGTSLATVHRPDFFLSVWILIPTLSAVFFVDVIPKIYSAISKTKIPSKNSQITVLAIIFVVLFMSIVFSYKGFLIYLYEDTYEDFKSELVKLVEENKILSPHGLDAKEIADVLAEQPNIQNSYVMAGGRDYSYLSSSKFIYSSFQEGDRYDTLDKFISRENWSKWDRYVSNSHSFPFDRSDKINPIPDYIVYNELQPHAIHLSDFDSTQFKDLKILLEPENPKIPENFEFIYKSNKTGTVIYKINNLEK